MDALSAYLHLKGVKTLNPSYQFEGLHPFDWKMSIVLETKDFMACFAGFGRFRKCCALRVDRSIAIPQQ